MDMRSSGQSYLQLVSLNQCMCSMPHCGLPLSFPLVHDGASFHSPGPATSTNPSVLNLSNSASSCSCRRPW